MPPAVFTVFPSAPPDEIPRRQIHRLLNVRFQMLTGFELEDRDKIRSVNQGLIFQPFVTRKHAVIGTLSRRIDSFLDRCGNLQLDYPACGFLVERQRLKGSRRPSRPVAALMSLRSHAVPFELGPAYGRRARDNSDAIGRRPARDASLRFSKTRHPLPALPETEADGLDSWTVEE